MLLFSKLINVSLRVMLGSRFDNCVHLCGIHIHFYRCDFLRMFSTAKKLHRRCKMMQFLKIYFI